MWGEIKKKNSRKKENIPLNMNNSNDYYNYNNSKSVNIIFSSQTKLDPILSSSSSTSTFFEVLENEGSFPSSTTGGLFDHFVQFKPTPIITDGLSKSSSSFSPLQKTDKKTILKNSSIVSGVGPFKVAIDRDGVNHSLKNHQKPTSSSLLKENKNIKILRSLANNDFLKNSKDDDV
jgi:hypothetical protein